MSRKKCRTARKLSFVEQCANARHLMRLEVLAHRKALEKSLT